MAHLVEIEECIVLNKWKSKRGTIKYQVLVRFNTNQYLIFSQKNKPHYERFKVWWSNKKKTEPCKACELP